MSRARKRDGQQKLQREAEHKLLGRRWRAALAIAGLTQDDWARSNGWSSNHVGQAVAGKRESSHVMVRVIEFIEQQEQQIAKRADVVSAETAPASADDVAA